MRRARGRLLFATALALGCFALPASLSSGARADEPPGGPPSGSAAPAPSGSAGATPADSVCGPLATSWAERASKKTGLAITATACPGHRVRVAVAGAGCDFDVTRDGGFERTPDGAFGVSPIANLDWSKAPAPMKGALAALLSALAADPSLPMVHEGASRAPMIVAGAAAVLVVLAIAAGLAWKRRKGKAAAAPPTATPPAA